MPKHHRLLRRCATWSHWDRAKERLACTCGFLRRTAWRKDHRQKDAAPGIVGITICLHLRFPPPICGHPLRSPSRKIFSGALTDWTDRTWTTVEVFRAVLALSVLRRQEFTRPIEAFAQATGRSTRSVLIETDASLTGLGVLIYSWLPGDRWVPLGGAACICIKQFGWEGKPEYQNSAEFIGMLCGFVMALRLGCECIDVTFRGDSKTALEWITAQRARSAPALNAAVIFVLLAIRMKLFKADTIWIESEANWRCDGLSRGDSWKVLQSKDPGWAEKPEELVNLCGFLRLCDPRLEWGSDEGVWQRVHTWLDSTAPLPGVSRC